MEKTWYTTVNTAFIMSKFIYLFLILLKFHEIVVSEGPMYVASSSSPVLRHECGNRERNSQPTMGYCQCLCFRLLVWCRSNLKKRINGCHHTGTKQLSTKVISNFHYRFVTCYYCCYHFLFNLLFIQCSLQQCSTGSTRNM